MHIFCADTLGSSELHSKFCLFAENKRKPAVLPTDPKLMLS